jgi:hypothetical protein
MRNELAIATSLDAGATANRDVWPIIGFCFIGLAVSLYLSLIAAPLNQIPLLITQYNLF